MGLVAAALSCGNGALYGTGSGAAGTSAGASGSGGTNAVSAGGSGGNAGSSNGGSAGSSNGGSAGSSDGGSAGSSDGGSAGSSNGGGGASCAKNLGGWIGTRTGGTGGGSAGTNSGGSTGGNTIAGSGGTSNGGRGGSGSSYPACTTTGPAAGRYAGGSLKNVDDTSILAPMTATVRMSAVDAWPGSSNGIRVTLSDTASTRQWVWWLAIPDLPPDRINGCDSYDLTVDARECSGYPGWAPCQTVVLARDGALVAFTVNLQAVGIPLPTALEPWGIAVADAGPFCEISSPTCGEVHHTARVTVGNESAMVVPWQTVTMQGLSISMGNFHSVIRIMCDLPASTTMVGFRLP